MSNSNTKMRQTKEKFLSQFTVNRHHKVVKHGEIEVTSLLSSLQIPNVSNILNSM
jgi:hypothetical protein